MARPVKYKTPEEMEEKIEEYFKTKGKVQPLVLELALHLGLTRQGLCEYQQKPEFKDIVSLAKARVEMSLERACYDPTRKNMNGIIFSLKNNFGWRDKIDVESNQNVTIIDHIPDPDKVPYAEEDEEDQIEV